MIVLSHVQVAPMMALRAGTQRQASLSPDLECSIVTVTVAPDGIRFPDACLLCWKDAETICAAKNSCFLLDESGLHKIVTFSKQTDRVYSLMPTRRAPTMLVSGVPMHRIKDTDPVTDTEEKIKAVRPIIGDVLDTCTGLGYTAIALARYADHVLTIELDPAAVEIARMNPWSRALFAESNIERRLGDSVEIIPGLVQASYDRILHDPPAMALGGDLYSAAFYRELFRLLRHNGRLFHYIGNPQSKSGETNWRGVVRRLRDAGFRRVQPRPQAFGVLALK